MNKPQLRSFTYAMYKLAPCFNVTTMCHNHRKRNYRLPTSLVAISVSILEITYFFFGTLKYKGLFEKKIVLVRTICK